MAKEYLCVFPTPVGMNRERVERSVNVVSVFPTPVGMNRIPHRQTTYNQRFPHTRGDEPNMVGLPVDAQKRFPHTRGDEPLEN